ncbi:MAG: hypothetical protein KJN81_01140 [Acidimicrobiia bacterium]|nr:hypothetical protein [Acidimicrobiia bacterium]
MCAAPADSRPIHGWETSSVRLEQAIEGLFTPVRERRAPVKLRGRRIPVRCTVMCVSVTHLPDNYVGDAVLAEIEEEIHAHHPDHTELGSDRVWAVFNLTDRDYDAPFHVAARIHSLTRILTRTLEQHGFSGAEASIGLAYGGGTRIAVGTDEVTFTGPVVEEARRLADFGGRNTGLDSGSSVRVSRSLNQMLSPRNRALLQYRPPFGMFHGNPVNHAMEAWLSVHMP